MLQAVDIAPSPLVLAVAPNGARRTSADHPRLPTAIPAIVRTAEEAHEAGANMLHLHVRDAGDRHSIDPTLYREASAAIRAALGDRMVIQITTESVGRFTPQEQIACVHAARPEAVSIAVREICPVGAEESALADLSAFMRRERIAPQFILYDTADVERFLDLRRRGIVTTRSVLYVLGRYAVGQRSSATDLLPFLRADEASGLLWMLCAFGPAERGCALAAAALGGHVRVGFENNLHLPDGSLAPDNAALVAGVAARLSDLGRRIASADEARALLAR